jgi:gas vesicle protein
VAKRVMPKGNYFMVGVGIGSLIGVLFAPKSGGETREYIAKKAKEGDFVVRKKARELRDRAEEKIEHGRGVVADTREQIRMAIDVGRETYKRELSGTHVG